jgi:hypothetical protein
VNPRSPLAKVDSVCLLTGKPPRVIHAMADGGDLVDGKLIWVWNVASNPGGAIEDRRFWVKEIADAAAVKNLTLAEVIDQIVPRTRREFPAGEVQMLLQVRHNTLLDLRAELQGQLRARCNFYPRAALVNFLYARWLGACARPLPAAGSRGENPKPI